MVSKKVKPETDRLLYDVVIVKHDGPKYRIKSKYPSTMSNGFLEHIVTLLTRTS